MLHRFFPKGDTYVTTNIVITPIGQPRRNIQADLEQAYAPISFFTKFYARSSRRLIHLVEPPDLTPLPHPRPLGCGAGSSPLSCEWQQNGIELFEKSFNERTARHPEERVRYIFQNVCEDLQGSSDSTQSPRNRW